MLGSFGLRCGAVCVVVSGLLGRAGIADRTGVVPPGARASQIAFASMRDGNWEIYVAESDGQGQTRLTRRDPQDRFPLWSPDKSQIAFGSQVSGDHWELRVMNANGTRPRFLATRIAAKGHRQWSPDGTRIVFAARVDGDVEVMSVEVASGRLTRLTRSRGEDADPSWSPDGRHIAFSSTRDGNEEVYVMRDDGTQFRRLTNHPERDLRPAWSPDGTTIAFVSSRDGNRDVYAVRFDDGGLVRLTTGALATNDGLRWAPSGAYFAVQTATGDNYDIQLVRMSDRERRTIAGTPAFDGQFGWSPAGDELAFISRGNGVDAVYITDLRGTTRRLSTTLSLNAEWSP